MDRYIPLQAVVELTNQCNLCCQHCGSSCTHKMNPDELTIEEWQGVIDQLVEFGTERIVFSGGEPTLKSDFDELLGYTATKGIKFALITNGYILPDNISEAIGQYRPYAIGVSLDGNEAVHNTIRGREDSWKRAFETIGSVRKLGIQVCAVTTVSKWNLHVLDELVAILSESVDSWQVQLASSFGRMKTQAEALLSEEGFRYLCRRVIMYRHLYSDLNIQAADCFGIAPPGVIRTGNWEGCTAGLWSLGIDACGNVLPCLSIQNGIHGGNIRQSSLEDIWNHSDCFDMNRAFNPEQASNGQCAACEQLAICRGGCASLSYSCSGEFHRAPLCYYRAFDSAPRGGVVTCTTY
jgi:radical SAM protein with 4Fe4S-binding SPASM domain